MKLRTAPDIRKSELAQIHVAKSQLGLDDETYRAMLWTVARVKSAADLDWAGRKKVIDHLKAKGFKIKGQQPRQAHKPLALSKTAIESKIGWQLGQLGKGWDYAYGVARRVVPGMDKFEFLSAAQLGDVSSALERTIRYADKKAAK